MHAFVVKNHQADTCEEGPDVSAAAPAVFDSRW